MPIDIRIENLRHIRTMDFSVPEAGVWLLTGANGTGKTSLLACMRRIGVSNAFPIHFPASQKSDKLDSYDGSSVRYQMNGSTVTYRYRGERWVPHPKANSGLLHQSGFPAVLHIAADAARIEPRKDDFQPRRVRAAHPDVIAGANSIFNTRKFDALKTINLRTGVGSDAFLLELPQVAGRASRSYISEKSLSLGELCILKLLRLLRDCPRGSLILIDELELALHPMAQVELLRYLEHISTDKVLTIVVSTHSSTLIKQARPRQLLLLQDQGDGNIVCQTKCFPSMVLGALAYREETAADLLIYVEDDAAQIYLEQLVFRFVQHTYADNQLAPAYHIIPVGGFVNVLRFFIRQRPLLPNITRCCVMLDADAEASLRAATVADIIEIRDRERTSISYLPITPEVGLAQFLCNETATAQTVLRQHYHHQIVLLARDVGPMPDANDRKACKRLVDAACAIIAGQLPNAAPTDVKGVLLKILADRFFTASRGPAMQLLGPVIRG